MNENQAQNVTYTNDEFSGLPKWPALVVAGQKVTEKQAAEILIRTDSHMPDFSYAGNDKHYANQVNALFGFDFVELDDLKNRQRIWEMAEELKGRMNILPVEYLSNDRIISAWIGGPHGWCNWNGDIFTNNYNIGKWPSVESVAYEWGIIAEAFPFLDLRAQLFDGETGEDDNHAIVEFIIKDGQVTVQEPTIPVAPPVFDLENFVHAIGNVQREQGISLQRLKRKIKLVYREIPQVNKNQEL